MTIIINGSGTISGVSNFANDATVTGNLTASGNIVSNGTVSDLTTVIRPLVTATAQATTSGTAIDFTGIPSWVKRITVMFNGVSLSGTSHVLLQLGTSSGIDATGYGGQSTISNTGSATVNSTIGIPIYFIIAAMTGSGTLSFFNISGNTWVASGVVAIVTSTNSVSIAGGSKTLSGVLDRIRITTVNGTDTFDAGSVNIMYE